MPNRQPNWTITQSQHQEQIGSEDCNSQERQKFRLAIAVKDQACDNQHLYLKCSKRREIVGPKYDYDEYAELPRCESHAVPLVIAENLSIQPRGGRRGELLNAVPWSGTGRFCCKSRLNRAVMAFVSAFPRRTPQADIVRRVENDSFHTAKALKQVRLPELADVVIDIGSLGPIAHSPEIRS